MRKFTIISVIISIIAISSSFAQQLSRQSISCMGSTEMSSEMTLRQTVGQSGNTNIFSNESQVLRQGFQQALNMLRITSPLIPSLDISVYPNPFTDHLYFVLNGDQDKYEFNIIDITGKLVAKDFIYGNLKTYVECKNWQPGSYFVIVLSGSEIIAKEKIIKIK
ncbi:MAG: T9SS type A sorting domain-containing protein [Bacteroidales bacterium]|nr:T9SS type A sorting domain-containing protein [Bacteroidales bacterium]MDY0215987.1 T9SS type A sorting domain-containing protein [Bacteroidales bacterium]